MKCGWCVVVIAVAALAWAPIARAGDVALSTEVVAQGLALPVYAAAPEGDDRLFVVEQFSGRIQIVQDGVTLPTPFLDIGAQVLGGGERGFLCLAFHPQYELNGRFYVTFNNKAGDLVLARFLVDPLDPDRALPGSQEQLLALPQPFAQHNGGMIAFGPDGLFYMSTGDGGGGGDPFDNAQDLSSLLGKLLRLDVDHGFPYVVPHDNPFVSVPGARGEVFAYGLRNPWRFSIDAPTQTAWIGDVGQGDREEISTMRLSQGGANFGWRCVEGTMCTGLAGCVCPSHGTVDPIWEYDHDEGCAVIGGYVYRGGAIPGLQGDYLFADYCTDRVWSFTPSPTGPVGFTERTFELTPPGEGLGFISSFGRDGHGELLIIGLEGVIRRIVAAPAVADCDGDGLSDEDELAGGTAFDANGNGLPDDCELLLTGTAFVERQPASLEFVGAKPGQLLAWFATTRGIGPGGPCYFGGTLCLDLVPVVLSPGQPPEVLLLALTVADAQGRGQLSLVVPPLASLGGADAAAFQVVAAAGLSSVKSNPIQKQIQSL